MKRRLILATAALLALSSGALANPPPALPPSPDDARWLAILQRLGSPDFAHRQAAQKELDQATWRDLDLLKKSAAAATDPEIKARLSTYLAVLTEDLAVNPPPISLDLKSATVWNVAETLGNVLHKKIDVWPSNVPTSGETSATFALSAKNQPFWEVFFALSRQHPLKIRQPDYKDFQRQQLTVDRWGYPAPVFAGPLVVIPRALVRTRIAALQRDTPDQLQPETLVLGCTFALDPRVRIMQRGPAQFSEIRDDLGNDLALPEAGQNVGDPEPSVMGTLGDYWSFRLKTTARRDARIVTAKGAIRYLVQTGVEHLDIADVETRMGQTIDIAGYGVKVALVDVSPTRDRVRLDLEVVRNPAQPPRFEYDGDPKGVVYVTLIDATGRETLLDPIYGVSKRAGSVIPFSAPLKMHLTVVTKTKDVAFPFELKDFPLP